MMDEDTTGRILMSLYMKESGFNEEVPPSLGDPSEEEMRAELVEAALAYFVNISHYVSGELQGENWKAVVRRFRKASTALIRAREARGIVVGLAWPAELLDKFV